MAEQIDGRRARGQRSRRQILEALAGLVREGTPAPASRVVAERAGVTQRTLFNHFEQLDDLYAEMGAIEFARLDEARPGAQPGGTLAERMDVELDNTTVFNERFRRVHSALCVRESSDGDIRELLSRVRDLSRTRLATTFSEEIRAAGDSGPLVLDQLATVTSGGVWDVLRDEMGQSVVEARACVAGLVAGALSGEARAATEASTKRDVTLDVVDLSSGTVPDIDLDSQNTPDRLS